MDTSRHAPLRLFTLLLTIALAASPLGAAQSPGGALPDRACRVVNATQKKHFVPDSGDALAAAIESADPDDELEITGICTGTYTLNKDLVLTGLTSRQFPISTLDGGQAGSTLTVLAGVNATLTNLTITGGTGLPDPLHLGAPGDGGGLSTWAT